MCVLVYTNLVSQLFDCKLHDRGEATPLFPPPLPVAGPAPSTESAPISVLSEHFPISILSVTDCESCYIKTLVSIKLDSLSKPNR